jgi:ABC-2 type transport system ATP-binding protein
MTDLWYSPSLMANAVLEVRGAKKRFRDVNALDGVDLSLGAGEWLGLLGPNGAGKSTLIRAVSGRVHLDAGEITLFGTKADKETRRRIGIVPQELAIYGKLNARENLDTFGALHGVTGTTLKKRVDEALEWTGLAERAKDRVKNYSGGMKRRLNLACGILHQPEIILLDEPTEGIDPQSRERIWQMLRDQRARGASLILTTHQLDEAEKTCERIAIIDQGKIVASGSFEELVERTIGKAKRLTIALSSPDAEKLRKDGFEPAGSSTVGRMLDNVAAELPSALRAIAAAGVEIENLTLEQPSLQAVFLQLTGKELRD